MTQPGQIVCSSRLNATFSDSLADKLKRSSPFGNGGQDKIEVQATAAAHFTHEHMWSSLVPSFFIAISMSINHFRLPVYSNRCPGPLLRQKNCLRLCCEAKHSPSSRRCLFRKVLCSPLAFESTLPISKQHSCCLQRFDKSKDFASQSCTSPSQFVIAELSMVIWTCTSMLSVSGWDFKWCCWSFAERFCWRAPMQECCLLFLGCLCLLGNAPQTWVWATMEEAISSFTFVHVLKLVSHLAFICKLHFPCSESCIYHSATGLRAVSNPTNSGHWSML